MEERELKSTTWWRPTGVSGSGFPDGQGWGAGLESRPGRAGPGGLFAGSQHESSGDRPLGGPMLHRGHFLFCHWNPTAVAS